MPTWRKLHVKTVESIDINDMPDDFTRLLWVLLPLALDREGRGLDHAGWVRSKVMPLREDVTSEMIQNALLWYQERGMIERYDQNGRKYFQIPTWHAHQGDTKREGVSHFPGPSQELVESNAGPSHDQGAERSCSDVDVDVEEDVEEKKPRKKSNEQPTISQEMFSVLAQVCSIDIKLITGKQRGQLNREGKKLRDGGISCEEVAAFGEWWSGVFWKGRDGQAPRPTQVREEWGQFAKWQEKDTAPGIVKVRV